LRRPTLDDVFLTLTGHAADEAQEQTDAAPELATAGRHSRRDS
jgi:ABC-2 type transport system ATP-binding protein